MVSVREWQLRMVAEYWLPVVPKVVKNLLFLTRTTESKTMAMAIGHIEEGKR